jgi:hypothetical protein
MSTAERDDIMEQLRTSLDRLRKAHGVAMECLERGDYDGFGELINTERLVIEEQEQLVERLRLLMATTDVVAPDTSSSV